MGQKNYKVNPLTGQLQEYVFEYNGILAMRNFVARVDGERLILHHTDDVNFSILDALVSEVEINGEVYDNPQEAQEALTRLTFNQNRPVILSETEKNLILNSLQKGTYQGTASDLKHQIENLTIGGRNLLKNTANPQQGNWFFGNCEVSFNQADVFGNNNAIKIHNFRSTDVYFADSSKINDFRKYGAGEYIFSGYFKCNRPTYNLPLHFNHTLIKKQVQITNQWQKISIPFRIQTIGDYAMFHIGGWRTMADFSNLEIDFCYLKIEKGNKPTDWTPAPEDVFIQQATSLLKTSASIRTSQDIGGFSQNGRTIVTQGTANIIVTIDSQDGFVATYQKAGTGNVTFVATGGKNLIQVDRENAIIGDKGSTATITIVENEILLRVHNV